MSAFATNAKLVLGQEAVDVKSNEITAIPALLERLDLNGALVSIDAMGCNPALAEAIVDAGADYLLAVKDNQPTLHAEIESYFDTAPAKELACAETLDKGHGRLEIRNHKVSKAIDWVDSARAYPGAKRFKNLAVIALVETKTEKGDKISTERRSYIARERSRPTTSLMPCVATGPSKTACTGSSTSPSRRICRACEPGTAPRTWPSSDISPSTWSDRPRTSAPSSDGEKSPLGTPNTCSKSYNPPPVNLDSLPW